jgi:hypothetical protein
LGERSLDPCFRDGGISECHGEHHPVFRNRGEFDDEIGECGIAAGAAEAHFHVVLDGLGCLDFERRSAFVPEEAALCGEAGVETILKASMAKIMEWS